jgi:hypothetical protein
MGIMGGVYRNFATVIIREGEGRVFAKVPVDIGGKPKKMTPCFLNPRGIFSKFIQGVKDRSSAKYILGIGKMVFNFFGGRKNY